MIIDGSAVNVAPVIDPVGAVVCAADVSNVDTVMVNGVVLKRASGQARSPTSRDFLVSQVPAQEGWLTGTLG